MLFHYNGYANASQCYGIRTLFVLFNVRLSDANSTRGWCNNSRSDIYFPLYLTVLEVAFATCNLTALCLRRYGACNLVCCGAERSIHSPCICSSVQTYSNFEVRPVMRLSCPEFPNLCIRILCLLTMKFQMFMHRLFQITSSDVNYT